MHCKLDTLTGIGNYSIVDEPRNLDSVKFSNAVPMNDCGRTELVNLWYNYVGRQQIMNYEKLFIAKKKRADNFLSESVVLCGEMRQVSCKCRLL